MKWVQIFYMLPYTKTAVCSDPLLLLLSGPVFTRFLLSQPVRIEFSQPIEIVKKKKTNSDFVWLKFLLDRV